MSPEHDKQLCEKYPRIFVNRNAPATESCMHWGFECGDGWHGLIDTLCEAIECVWSTSIEVTEEDALSLGIQPTQWKLKSNGDHFPFEEPKNFYFFEVKAPQVVASQVKEKFGSLRFYYSTVYCQKNQKLVETRRYPELQEINEKFENYIAGIVHFAEVASARTCEVSGDQGSIHVRKGWLKVLSPAVAALPEYAEYKPYSITR